MSDISQINIPDLGDVDEVEVIEVCVEVGQKVESEDSIMILETDKAAMEIPASIDGVVKNILINLNLFLSNVNKYLKLDYKIILIYPIPQFSSNVSDSIFELYNKDKKNFLKNILKKENHIKLSFDEFVNDTKYVHKNFDKLKHKNLHRVFPESIFCNQVIKGKCLGNSSEDIYFIDTSHLSKKGSNMINVNLIKVIDQIYSNN